MELDTLINIINQSKNHSITYNEIKQIISIFFHVSDTWNNILRG